MKKIFKSCSIYRKPQGFFILGYLRTPYGGVGRPPATKLPLTAPPSDAGDAVLRIFGELSGEATDVDLGSAMASFRAHLKELGFKTVAALEKNASVTDVEFDGEFYSIVSTEKDEHEANKHGHRQKLSPAATPEEIGNAIFAAFGDGLT